MTPRGASPLARRLWTTRHARSSACTGLGLAAKVLREPPVQCTVKGRSAPSRQARRGPEYPVQLDDSRGNIVLRSSFQPFENRVRESQKPLTPRNTPTSAPRSTPSSAIARHKKPPIRKLRGPRTKRCGGVVSRHKIQGSSGDLHDRAPRSSRHLGARRELGELGLGAHSRSRGRVGQDSR